MAKQKKEKQEKKKKDYAELKWFITVFITTFILSIVFSYLSTNSISNLELIPAIVILALVILVGIVFDIIGVAVTVANENEFHAKATKKVEGSKTSIRLIRNSAKVANICADVIRRYLWGTKWFDQCYDCHENHTNISNAI